MATITNSSSTSQKISPTEKKLVGWVFESSGRGTLSLITLCLATTFLCTWVVIHPRVYKRQRFAALHKLALFSKTILAPELIAVEGLQEWAQCKRMVKECSAYTQGQFKLIHAFYLSMLALRYRTPRGNRVIWPNQYAWLLRERLILWKDHAEWGLSEDNIWDKSKSDAFTKLLALTQVSWFVVQCIMRGAQRLPISQIEAMTLGYIPVFMACYFFWWYKPKDIRSPSLVDLPHMSHEQMCDFELMAVSNKFDDEGEPDQVTYLNIWYLTPRLFEKEAEDKAIRDAQMKIAAQHEGQAEHRLKSTQPKYTTAPSVQELQAELRKEIVLSHWDPQLYRSRIWPLMCLFSILFPALHLASWDTIFPSAAEMWLWRGAVFLSILSMLVFMHFEKVVFRWEGIVTVISIASPGLYFFSRIIMLAEVFVTLRAEDPKVYDTFVVSTYWLHLL